MIQNKRILSLLMILAILFSCAAGSWAEQDGALPDDAGDAAESGLVLNDGTPWVDYSLRENLALVEEKPDSPKDDFYLWSNYDWLKTAEISPGDYTADVFTDTDQEIMAQCLDVLTDTSLKSEDATMVQYLYNAFLDWDARNALGVAPLQEITDSIRAVSTLDELNQLLCDKNYAGELLLSCDVAVGANDPETWIVDIQPVSLLLMDSAEYREPTEQGNLLKAVFTEILSKILERLGYSPEEASGMTARVFALEAELADSIMTSAEGMSPDYLQRINNEMNRTEAETLCSAFPLLAIVDSLGYAGAQRFLVEEPAYLQKLDGIYREDRLEDLKTYLIACTAVRHMYELDRECYDLCNTLYSAFGVEGAAPDEEEACLAVRSKLPSQMARALFEKYDITKMKADITRLCEETIGCYRKMLSEENWLTEETRTKAIEKLDAMRIIAVCPEKWPDYSGLSLEGLGYFDCCREIRRCRRLFSVSLADQPVDHDLWYCTLGNAWANDILESNAVYDPGSNTFTILRGILGSAFYREDMSEEELYGAIGCIIGHEISHAFDPTGAQYDAAGRLNNWWTETDETAFSARAEKLVDYYNGITVFSGLQVPGESVQGEAVADMGGVQCMLNLLEEKKKDVDYRAFFETIAGIWRGIITWEMEFYALLQDPHLPNHLRVNTLMQQFPQFYETYGITEGDGMWLAPEDRVRIW